MKNVLLIVLAIISLSANAIAENGKFKINSLPDSLVPIFRYNMNVALFQGKNNDSVYVVNLKGDLIFKGPNKDNVIFNSNIDFNGVGDALFTRYDFNLDGVYPIVIKDDVDNSTYAIDYNGHTIIQKGKYDFISAFVDGYARVYKDDQWGVIDINSKEIVPLSISDASLIFINHNIWVYYENDSKWHMIDNHGKDVCSFDQVTHNYNTTMSLVEKNFIYYMKNRELGISIVRNGNKWGAVDKSGKIIIPFVNDNPSSLYKCEDGRWIYGESVFDQNGKLIFKQNDFQTSTTIEYGIIMTEKFEQKGNTYSLNFGLYDTKGIKTNFIQISENVRWHLIGNEWALEDNKGRIISGPYEDVEFKHDCPAKDIAPWYGKKAGDFFKVVEDNKAGMIDVNGKFVLPMKFSTCQVSGNVFEANIIDGPIRYSGFFDFTGKMIRPLELHKRFAYEDFGWHYEGTDCTLDAYQVNGKWGLLDMETKKTIVPFCLDDVLAFMHGVGVVKYKGRLYYINEKGEGLPDEVYQMK